MKWGKRVTETLSSVFIVLVFAISVTLIVFGIYLLQDPYAAGGFDFTFFCYITIGVGVLLLLLVSLLGLKYLWATKYRRICSGITMVTLIVITLVIVVGNYRS